MNQQDQPGKTEPPKDPQLDTPSVANEGKHINFREEEEKDQSSLLRTDLANEADEQRKQQWKEGIEAGKRENSSDLPFQEGSENQPD